ncbi:hypothetical protein QFC21_002788 [Naganishia friedmannii]|uniref:Uncharacterized protein n=1 Tax=Naganishia friedmannii TaxID=89922 RepID=A0ACC2VT68_9TREE|nr:hypothetical protein QFC21_002788 [Naganishia friedmannii]
MDTSTSTAFQLRLQWLEAILSSPESTIRQSLVYSRDSSQANTLPGQDGKAAEVSRAEKDVTGRTADILQLLRNAVLDSGHDSLRRLIDEYDSIAPVLLPIKPSPPTTVHDEPPTGKPSDTRKTISSADTLKVKPTELIPASTKLELVLGASDDLKDAERMLREIEVLLERGVDGSGDLASHENLLSRLRQLQVTHSARLASSRQIQERVIDVLGRYDDYVTEMEEQVGQLERRKKQEEEMTY